VQASWGLWAGIWIDGQLSPVAPLLRAIAAESARPHDIPDTVTVTAAPPTVDDRPLPLPRRRPTRRPDSVRATVLARCSGHCEVMSGGCRFSADVHLSRDPRRDPTHMASAAGVFAACRRCAETVDARRDDAARLGWRVEHPGQVHQAPFFWRSARWVRFDARGLVRDVEPPAAQSRQAS
jgi:hypothetical protein